MKVAVFGLGYVGTVTAACLASKGHLVWGVDPEHSKVDALSAGRSPVVEPCLGELVAGAVARGTLRATTQPFEAVDGANISFVCVGTPSSPSGSTDVSFVMRAVKEIGQAVRATGGQSGFHTVVIRSTVPPGTVEDLVIPALEAEIGRPEGSVFGVAMCPEFLREGSGVEDFYHPPFTVVGTESAQAATALAGALMFLESPFRIVPIRTAEGLKYASNAFHALKVSFTNELSRLYRTLGIDARTVMDLFCEDDQLNISPRYLRPGFAFGGSCLPKDLRSLLYLARMNSVELPVLAGALVSNDLAVKDVVQRALAVDGRRIALLGLSFKMQTDDLRESPNVELAETLIGKGFEISIYDPIVQPVRLVGTNLAYIQSKLPHLQSLLAHSAEEALADADAAIVSSCDAAVVQALLLNPPRTIIDLVGLLGAEVEAIPGYQGAGW